MNSLTRRTFLRASGVAVGLPFLESVRGAERKVAAKRRLVAVNVGLGLHTPNIVPAQGST